MARLVEHRQRDQMDRWLLAGKSVRWVASQLVPPVSFQTVQRYRSVLLKPAVQRVAAKFNSVSDLPVATVEDGHVVERPLRDVMLREQMESRVNPFVSRSDALYKEAWENVLDARRAVQTFVDDKGVERPVSATLAVVPPAVSAAAKALELYGKGTGYLQDAVPGATNVVIVLPSTAVMQQPADEGQVIEVVAEKVP